MILLLISYINTDFIPINPLELSKIDYIRLVANISMLLYNNHQYFIST